jgi:hypothetical protein
MLRLCRLCPVDVGEMIIYFVLVNCKHTGRAQEESEGRFPSVYERSAAVGVGTVNNKYSLMRNPGGVTDDRAW